MQASDFKIGSKVRFNGYLYRVAGPDQKDPATLHLYGGPRFHRFARKVDPATVTVYDPAAEKAAKEAKKLEEADTCQICGRPIFSNNGAKIAHHGYLRPGDGRQTPSCYGARYKPFEESRDRLGWYIEHVATPSREDAEKALAAVVNDPAAQVPGPQVYKLDENGKKIYDPRKHDYVKVTQLVGPEHQPSGYYESRYNYAHYRRVFIANLENELKWAREHEVEQQKRFDTWKPGSGWRSDYRKGGK